MNRLALAALLVPAMLCGCGDDGGGGQGSDGAEGSGTAVAMMTAPATETTSSVADDSGTTGSDPATGSGDDATTGAVDGTGDTSADGTTGSDGATSTGALECVVGERVYQGDGCNFCDCTDTGLDHCTTRTCVPLHDGCDYAGMHYQYAETFDSTDRCNVCVCAASGLACTRRPECVDGLEEGAVLLESLDAPCGGFKAFTGQSVLDLLEPTVRQGPLDYANSGPLYPETLPDTTMTVRVTYTGGFIVCRIPAAGQEALDIEAILEWQTADGAFDEGQQTYIRDNHSGFLDAITTVASLTPTQLNGTYAPNCFDAGSISFGPYFYDDGTAAGGVVKTCETDIGLTVGDWASPG